MSGKSFDPSRRARLVPPSAGRRFRFVLGGAVGLLILGAQAADEYPGADRPSPEWTTEGFRVPRPHPEFVFPRDHGSHPDYRIEWWYVTAHLRAGAARRFGLHATFFRFGLEKPRLGTEPNGLAGANEPSSKGVGTPSAFGVAQIFLAHMAITDVAGRRFLYEERLNRDGWDAGADVEDLRVRNGNWSLRREPDAGSDETMRLKASVRAEATFDLRLTPAKGKVVFGRNGVSRKGADRTAASYYITFPRLAVSGELWWNGEALRVDGTAWMDHEISSSQLGAEQVGWDWAGIRLHDGREIMVYVMRLASGQPDPHSMLAWVTETGEVRHARVDRFSWVTLRTWRSARNEVEYPVESRLQTTDPESGEELSFVLRPLLDDQEIGGELGGIAYWEGACDVLGPGGRVVGEAYVELTGYDGRLSQRLR